MGASLSPLDSSDRGLNNTEGGGEEEEEEEEEEKEKEGLKRAPYVFPAKSDALISAFELTNVSVTSTCPYDAARCSGVSP
jgi:hypothetical protein